MKQLIKLFLILVMIVSFTSCLTDRQEKVRALTIGDTFIYQNDSDVSIARADNNVIIYRHRAHNHTPEYCYFSTHRRDSVIYDIRTVVR